MLVFTGKTDARRGRRLRADRPAGPGRPPIDGGAGFPPTGRVPAPCRRPKWKMPVDPHRPFFAGLPAGRGTVPPARDAANSSPERKKGYGWLFPRAS